MNTTDHFSLFNISARSPTVFHPGAAMPRLLAAGKTWVILTSCQSNHERAQPQRSNHINHFHNSKIQNTEVFFLHAIEFCRQKSCVGTCTPRALPVATLSIASPPETFEHKITKSQDAQHIHSHDDLPPPPPLCTLRKFIRSTTMICTVRYLQNSLTSRPSPHPHHPQT